MDGFSHFKTIRFIGKLIFIATITFLTVTLALPYSDVSFAFPPAQGPDPNAGSGLEFQASSYSTGNGSAAILSQETSLTAAYFGSHGTLEGLAVTSEGLQLASGATTGSYTSDSIASPLSVTTDLIPSWQADLPADASFKLETRLSPDGQTWTDWAENPEAFYPVRDNEHGGTMIWIGSQGPVSVQTRLTLSGATGSPSPRLKYLTLVFNDASGGPTDAALAAYLPLDASIAANVCPAPKPAIIPRSEWGAPDGQSSPRWPPQPTQVTHVIVHHTATPSTFAEWNRRSPYFRINDWTTVVRAIWNYHANVNRWGDIGYNYVIDPDGKIYEGRAGSQNGTLDIAGAHDGKNRNSLGLGFIGCYGNCGSLGLQNAQPPQVMVNKGVELIAWKFGEKHIDPKSQARYHGLLIPTIAGGRDVSSTYSPGDNLYATWLPWMRNAVADRVACSAPSPTPISTLTPVPAPTSTPAPAPTSTLTPMPAPTSTPAQTGSSVGFDPPTVNLTTCQTSAVTRLLGRQMVALKSFDLQLRFNPAVVQVVDADPNQAGVQIRVGADFRDQTSFVIANSVDQSTGQIALVLTLLGQISVSGDAALAEIEWAPVQAGTADLSVENITLVKDDNTALQATLNSGRITVTACSTNITGQVQLQGRTNHSGIMVSDNQGQQVQTGTDGSFTMGQSVSLSAGFPGYLTAQADVETRLQAASAAGASSSTSLGSITLLAGDITGDNLIDIFDLAYIANHYRSTDPSADLNSDGFVDILDLALAAGNYRQQGPLTNWQ